MHKQEMIVQQQAQAGSRVTLFPLGTQEPRGLQLHMPHCLYSAPPWQQHPAVLAALVGWTQSVLCFPPPGPGCAARTEHKVTPEHGACLQLSKPGPKGLQYHRKTFSTCPVGKIPCHAGLSCDLQSALQMTCTLDVIGRVDLVRMTVVMYLAYMQYTSQQDMLAEQEVVKRHTAA